MTAKPMPRRKIQRQALLFSLAALLLCCLRGVSFAEDQFFVITKDGTVPIQDVKDLDKATYDFSGVQDRSRFEFLKLWGLSSITPKELYAIFGERKISYGYIYNICSEKVHTPKDIKPECLRVKNVVIDIKSDIVTIKTSE